MLALTLSERSLRLRRDHPMPEAAGEALIRVHLAGICATDLELTRGYMGFSGVLGHEWVGTVEAAADSSWVGARVVGDINCACGRCDSCQQGHPHHCAQRTVLGIVGRDGAFATHTRLPVGNLHRVPAGVPDEAAVFVEPLAAACRIVEQLHIRPSDRVLVLGLGRLGQLCARVLALTGASVTGISRREGPLALLPPSVAGARLDEADDLRGADVVVDCTGNPAGLGLASRLVRPEGTVVLKTTTHDLAPPPTNGWVIDEVRVIGSRCGPFAPALRLLAAGLVDPRPLITAWRPLSAGVEAMAEAAAPGSIKVLLQP
jgi:alcohol dehydrogenase